jgi:hypothetical protein
MKIKIIQELIIIKEVSKIIFCSSKFAWVQESFSLTFVENLFTHPQEGSLALS